MRSRVLLPAPFGPSTARHSPAARSTSTRSTQSPFTASQRARHFFIGVGPLSIPCSMRQFSMQIS